MKPQKTLKKGSTTRKKQLIIPKEETLAEVAPIKPVEEERDVEYCPPRPTGEPPLRCPEFESNPSSSPR